jgi:NAD(P)-dependent dehydrogenase (short-subunit alcohol dehydrogenase family)
MMNRVIIITGANRGIGKATVRGLASNPKSTIIMACRNLVKSIPVCEEIKRETQNPNIEVMELDLGSFESIRSFVANFNHRYGRVNVLINNAGMTSRTYGQTRDGFEQIVGTNYFGTFLLTRLLLPLFLEGADNRIINLSSMIYKYGAFKIEKLQRYRWVKAYAVSKYLILLFTFELAERLKSRTGAPEITVNAVHPGIVSTPIMMTNRWYDMIIDLMLKPFYVNEETGAKPSIHLAASEDVRGITGGYFSKGKLTAVPKRFQNPALRKELWETTERILKINSEI